ncbi:hypothetical protein POV27_03460 [Aureisphaera galaxeae]|uniref:hypothetical protein n=1 Tax=Aureisphaera galaxeae TaxID=1538023 RepID=UPI002350BD22|nr:hypothetical protein [Aureisphaera galaxeae]MDC8003091.1 hypothetical protein [Aureisphaera galaxeae]
MSNWKKVLKKVTDSTSNAFGKGKDMVAINKHKSAINNCFKEIGSRIYESYKEGKTNMSLNDIEIQNILQDVEYHLKKIDKISNQ